ncbi:MAG TPA: hypothetical protein VGE01_02495 [Fimbriimonas sp.]
MLKDIFPFLIPLVIFMIPIVAILTTHQRKMAELMHRNPSQQYNPEIAALRQEVMELKQLIYQQSIAMDNLTALQARSTPPATLEERINGGAR